MSNIYKGAKGELLAEKFLLKKGYIIADKNVKIGGAEIDIIAIHPIKTQKKELKCELKNVQINKDVYKTEVKNIDEKLVFVEVKYSSSKEFGEPFERVTEFKKHQIYKAALSYINKKNLFDMSIRFDVISIVDDEVEHLVNAFEVN